MSEERATRRARRCSVGRAGGPAARSPRSRWQPGKHAKKSQNPQRGGGVRRNLQSGWPWSAACLVLHEVLEIYTSGECARGQFLPPTLYLDRFALSGFDTCPPSGLAFVRLARYCGIRAGMSGQSAERRAVRAGAVLKQRGRPHARITALRQHLTTLVTKVGLW